MVKFAFGQATNHANVGCGANYAYLGIIFPVQLQYIAPLTSLVTFRSMKEHKHTALQTEIAYITDNKRAYLSTGCKAAADL